MTDAALIGERVRPPPATRRGAWGWARANLFSSPTNAFLTILGLALLYWTIPPALEWAFVDAVWQGESREACLGISGACWPFVEAKLGQFIYGRYPDELRWRVDLVYLMGAIGVGAFVIPGIPGKRYSGIFLLTVFPVISFVLLSGGMFGIEAVPTNRWGGLLVTLVVAVTGIMASLPIGIVLALGRRSTMPIIRWFSIAYIEFWRGAPLIIVLFMASVMLPLFLPEGVNFDKLLRALVGVALFASAYMAEVVRGGLQAIPRGQYEAAEALGLSYWKAMGFIILPQALRLVIPGIVNTFIGLFKDTTLVSIVGLFDLLGIIQFNFTDANWSTEQTHYTGYVFAAVVFWAFCFGMSRYSQYVERMLSAGRRRAGGNNA